jgi:hypothetical protein
MGLLSFGTLLKLIPSSAGTIYVFTEYGNRLKGTPLENAAGHVLHRLYSVLSTAYPTAAVVIKRGGNEATAVSQLALAKMVTICSPSTFCFWSAVAQTNYAYMPPTSYIAYDRGTHKHENVFHEKFRWLWDGAVFKNFTKETDPRDILKTITRDVNRTILQKSHSRHESYSFK